MSIQSSIDINKAWLNYIRGREINPDGVRSEVLESWKRSAAYQVNPFQEKVSDVLHLPKLKSVRDENELLISYAEPRMKELADSFHGSNALVTMSDRNGVIINTFGNKEILHKSEGIGLIPGSVWNEEVAGTNAVGVVLKTEKPIQILFSEHYSTGWHDWSSTAAPIFHPFTKELIGVYDIAGTFKDVSNQTLQLAILKTQVITQDLFKQLTQDTLINNSYLQAVIDSNQDGIILLDKNKQVVKMNHVISRFFESSQKTALFEDNAINQIKQLIINGELSEARDNLKINNQEYIVEAFPVMMDRQVNGVILVVKKMHKKEIYIGKNRADKKRTSYDFDHLIGDSPIMQSAISQAKKAADLDVNLFISGETGTGKEVFAQAIHKLSPRQSEPFIAVNSGAIPDELITSELFGYEAGAFTGASPSGKVGKFEQANGGTLFLDEIGEMPLNVQVLILRAIEERVITRVGGTKEIKIDIRLITATHKDLYNEVLENRFREDLYYRLDVINLKLPELNKRGADILLLSSHYLQLYEKEYFKADCYLTEEVKETLLNYDWPGNVRELRNVVQQILFKLEGNAIEVKHLPQHMQVNQSVDSAKEKYVKTILNYQGDMDRAAEKLEISRATLYRRLQAYNLTKKIIMEQADN